MGENPTEEPHRAASTPNTEPVGAIFDDDRLSVDVLLNLVVKADCEGIGNLALTNVQTRDYLRSDGFWVAAAALRGIELVPELPPYLAFMASCFDAEARAAAAQALLNSSFRSAVLSFDWSSALTALLAGADPLFVEMDAMATRINPAPFQIDVSLVDEAESNSLTALCHEWLKRGGAVSPSVNMRDIKYGVLCDVLKRAIRELDVRTVQRVAMSCEALSNSPLDEHFYTLTTAPVYRANLPASPFIRAIRGEQEADEALAAIGATGALKDVSEIGTNELMRMDDLAGIARRMRMAGLTTAVKTIETLLAARARIVYPPRPPATPEWPSADVLREVSQPGWLLAREEARDQQRRPLRDAAYLATPSLPSHLTAALTRERLVANRDRLQRFIDAVRAGREAGRRITDEEYVGHIYDRALAAVTFYDSEIEQRTLTQAVVETRASTRSARAEQVRLWLAQQTDRMKMRVRTMREAREAREARETRQQTTTEAALRWASQAAARLRELLGIEPEEASAGEAPRVWV